MPGTVTIDWKITTDVAGTIPATGKVRWHLPRVVLTDEVIAGLAPTPWVDLVNGAGSIIIVDPWDPTIAPQGWAPEVEIESNALNARYGVAIPEGSAGQTLDLHALTTIPQAALGDLYALVNHTHDGSGGGVPTTRQILAGTGLTGGGTLAADRTISLNTASIASLAKADTAVQPGLLAAVATSGAKADVGLGNVDNTADTAKPVSTAQAAADANRGVQATASSGIAHAVFTGDTSGAWTLCPAAYRVTIPAAVGDVLHWEPHLLVNVGADAELDVTSVVSGAPARYFSSGTTTQGANGHGGLYIGTGYNRALKPIRWIVTADDLDGGNVTLALMYRNGTGVTFGHAVYPGQVDVTNLGGVA